MNELNNHFVIIQVVLLSCAMSRKVTLLIPQSIMWKRWNFLNRDWNIMGIKSFIKNWISN